MRRLLLALGFLGYGTVAKAVVLLANYDGTSLPGSQGWTLTVGSTTETQVVTDRGRSALKITDSNGTSGREYLNINKALSVADANTLFGNGFEFRLTLRIPEFDDQNSQAWALGQNIFTSLVRDHGGGQRTSYNLQFGRNAEGLMQVRTATNASNVMILDNEYHEFKLVYDKDEQVARIFIDDVYWQNLTPATMSGSGGYWSWGDNENQSTARLARSWYVASASLVMVPEPRTSLLVIAGLAAGALRRRRFYCA